MISDSLIHLRKFLTPEIVYGQGAMNLSGRHAGNFGASRVCIVTDPGVRKAGWTSSVEKSLKHAGLPYIVYDNVTPNPKDHEVMEGSALCIQEACDLLIAVGGGSPMDCAKGMGVVMGNSGNILQYEGVDMIPNPSPPLIFIPTTAGSSADVSQFAIITDTTRKVKIAIISKMVIPDIALIDPETTATMPPDLTVATGMDALCHAFEAFVSTASSPLTDMAALSSVQIISENLLKTYNTPDNMLFRDKMMTASLMAGLAFSNASLGLVHSMAHSLGGALGLSHGECNALLLENVAEFNYSSSPEKYDQLAKAMGLDMKTFTVKERGSALSRHISSLRKRVGINQSLSDLGIQHSELQQLSEFAYMDPCLATNPRDVAPSDIENIYLQAF